VQLVGFPLCTSMKLLEDENFGFPNVIFQLLKLLEDENFGFPNVIFQYYYSLNSRYYFIITKLDHFKLLRDVLKKNQTHPTPPTAHRSLSRTSRRGIKCPKTIRLGIVKCFLVSILSNHQEFVMLAFVMMVLTNMIGGNKALYGTSK